MNNLIAKINFVINYIKSEEGQDLVEYALVVALIAFAATAGMNKIALDINAAFTNLGTELTSLTA